MRTNIVESGAQKYWDLSLSVRGKHPQPKFFLLIEAMTAANDLVHHPNFRVAQGAVEICELLINDEKPQTNTLTSC